MPPLIERFRPRSFADVVGQDEAIASIQTVLKGGWGGRAWWITGLSGMGKTTLAKIIGGLGAAPLCTVELQACDITPKCVRETAELYRCRPLPIGDKQGWCIIVNECHKLPRHGVTALLDALESLPEWACWVFTTTKAGQQSFFDDDTKIDAKPLRDRCQVIRLDDGDHVYAKMALRAKAIAGEVGLDGLPDTVYVEAMRACKSMRELLQQVESGQLRRGAREHLLAELAALPLERKHAAERTRLQKLLDQIGG